MARKLVTGLFKSFMSLEEAVAAAIKRGYSGDEVSVMTSRAALETARPEAAGALFDGTVSAAVAAVVAAGSDLLVPGYGFVAAGPLAAAFTVAGASGGEALLRALVGAGIPEEKARAYDDELKRGAALVGVEARSEEDVSFFEKLFGEAPLERRAPLLS